MSRHFLGLLFAASVVTAQETAPDPAKVAPAKTEPATARVAELVIKLENTEDPHPANPFGPQALNFRGLLKVIEQAARDPEIDAIELRPKSYGVGWARLLEVREKLREVRRAGKKIFFYKEVITAPDMILASMADRISMPESGNLVLPGLAIESWYMREMLAKIRIRFDVIHIGEYKAAGESLVRDTMSEQLKEELNPILDEFYASMVGAIADGRRIPVDRVKAAIDKGILTARQAKEAGLIDRVEYRDQFAASVKAFFPGKRVIKVKNYGVTDTSVKFDQDNPFAALGALIEILSGSAKAPVPEGPKIAVVYCSGMIVSGKSQYDWQGNISAMGSETIAKAIKTAARDKDVRAIVLRINSPGGSALASDIIWRAVEQAKARKKPVIASMGDVAASGGYYIAMNSDRIVAEPQTITGSIGVVGMIPNVDELFPWVGINPQRLVRGKRAAALLTSKGLSADDREFIRALMGETYEDFVSKVASGRGKTVDEIKKIAEGRIYTGRRAKEIGLVDELGGLEHAIALARKRTGLAPDVKVHVIESPNRAGPLEFIKDMFEARLRLEGIVVREIPGLERILWRIRILKLMGSDRVCCVAPELLDVGAPFRQQIR